MAKITVAIRVDEEVKKFLDSIPFGLKSQFVNSLIRNFMRDRTVKDAIEFLVTEEAKVNYQGKPSSEKGKSGLEKLEQMADEFL